MDVVAPRLFIKDLHDLTKAGCIHGIAFASGAKYVKMVETDFQGTPHFAPKEFFHQVLVLVPGNFTGH
jgi:hypothetical protein